MPVLLDRDVGRWDTARMTWKSEWNFLRGRIYSLRESGELYFISLDGAGADMGSVSNSFLIPTAQDIFRRLRQFFEAWQNVLPTEAAGRLKEFLARHSRSVEQPGLGIGGVQFLLVLISSFASELDYYLADSEVRYRHRAELAFLHLQRSIVADESVAAKWRNTFARGEVACEKLGAAHLLSHSIWPFKVEAAGERTDLILSQPIVLDEVERTGTVLTLTEWKIAEDDSDAQKKQALALTQARAYAHGALSGVELRSVRYIVVVSRSQVRLPGDFSEFGHTYRHVNIAVEPKPPSKLPPATEA